LGTQICSYCYLLLKLHNFAEINSRPSSDHQYEEGCIAREEGCSSEAEECEIADGEERSDQEGEEVKIFI